MLWLIISIIISLLILAVISGAGSFDNHSILVHLICSIVILQNFNVNWHIRVEILLLLLPLPLWQNTYRILLLLMVAIIIGKVVFSISSSSAIELLLEMHTLQVIGVAFHDC